MSVRRLADFLTNKWPKLYFAPLKESDMDRRHFLGLLGLTAVAGCTDTSASDEDSSNAETPTAECECPDGTPQSDTAANIRLAGVGQEERQNGTAIRVQGSVANYGSRSHNTTARIHLLSGSEVVAEREIHIGELAPDESATFTTTIEVNASRVDGRKITFE